jgi:hypothetical protein
MFSLVKQGTKLQNFHHFGCPVYVLDHNLQAGRRSGMKWKDRVRLGINLGFSPQHAKSVHLVLSLTSGCVLPQFHCTFNSNFETLKDYSVPESLWQEKAHFVVKNNMQRGQESNKDKSMTTNDLPNNESYEPDRQNEDELDIQIAPQDEIEPPQQQSIIETDESQGQNSGNRRSNRVRRMPIRYKDYVMGNQTTLHNENTHIEGEVLNQPIIKDVIALKSITDPDTMYLWQARKEPDFHKFMEAMQNEIDEHTKGGHWKIMRKEAIPSDATVLPAVWSMKRKRRIADREVYKWKARLNIDGSRQVQGVHYQDTYSPVVSWSTTCFFLIHALLNGWHTTQIDYVMAFPQAPVE